jgi:hypothetical protein
MRYRSVALLAAIALCSTGTLQAAADSLIVSQVLIDQIDKAIGKIEKGLPPTIQSAAGKVREDLGKLSDEDVNVLHYSSDVCKVPNIIINCNGIPANDAKAFVSAERDRRQALREALKTEEIKKDTDRTFYVASGGLAVSIASLGISAFGARRKQTPVET